MQILIRSGIVLDVETTGLDRNEDKVIEIGLREFEFNRLTGEVILLGEAYNGLQDPGQPLSAEITALTGIDDSMVAGQAIDWQWVQEAIARSQVIIAHNATFDRPFIERAVTVAQPKVWACSLKQIDWKSKGYPSSKLEFLCVYHGFFTGAHRALNDADALLRLLSITDVLTGRPYLNEMISNARRPLVKVAANGAPFETKDILRMRGYSWDKSNRYWHRAVYKDDLTQEVSWLESQVYLGVFAGSTREIPISENFKAERL